MFGTLKNFPDNIYPDEIMTGAVATHSYVSPTTRRPPVFGTLWSGIDLPAFWFWLVAAFIDLGGTSLAILRLPAALFGAATVVPLYAVLRGTWGRYAATAGSTMIAFSVSNIHPRNVYAVPSCCALETSSPVCSRFLSFAAAYFVGFGPLLIHFVRNPNLYLGRGASLLIWSPYIPISFADFRKALETICALLSENLLGISTHSSQDIIFYAPLLFPVEAALLVLGVALLLWHWRHPAAFLMLSSGLSVLLVGGTLVAYPNSTPPLLNHWTPAFPAFFVALAVPVGAWIKAGQSKLKVRLRWLLPATVGIALLALGWSNLKFYFHDYYADPESLKSKAYRLAKRNYEVQTAQSRYLASLGCHYEVFTVGQSPWPYDPLTTEYLVTQQKWTLLTDPVTQLASISRDSRKLAFLFFPGNEQYQQTTEKFLHGGKQGEVRSRRGNHLFYTYPLTRP